jgi:hypothetical protein
MHNMLAMMLIVLVVRTVQATLATARTGSAATTSACWSIRTGLAVSSPTSREASREKHDSSKVTQVDLRSAPG